MNTPFFRCIFADMSVSLSIQTKMDSSPITKLAKNWLSQTQSGNLWQNHTLHVYVHVYVYVRISRSSSITGTSRCPPGKADSRPLVRHSKLHTHLQVEGIPHPLSTMGSLEVQVGVPLGGRVAGFWVCQKPSRVTHAYHWACVWHFFFFLIFLNLVYLWCGDRGQEDSWNQCDYCIAKGKTRRFV